MPETEADNMWRLRFGRAFGTYDSAAEVQRIMAHRLCEMLLAETSARSFGSVIELGCGTGLLTRELAGNISWDRMTLFDIEEKASVLADEKKKISFVKCDISEAPEFPASDLVVSGAALQWICDPEKLFAEIYAALDGRNGIFAFSTFAPGNLCEINEISGRTLDYISGSGISTLLSKCGFTVKIAEHETRVLEFDTPQSVLKHLRDTGVNAFTGRRRWTRSMLQELCGKYEGFRLANGKYPLTYTPLYFIASKGK